MMETNGLFKLGDLTKPVTVLIEKISSAIGTLYEPKKIEREAKAKAQAKIIEALANIEIGKIEERAINRLIEDEVRNQKNIEKIVFNAIEQIGVNAEPEKMDEDWINHFFQSCKNISNNEMQYIWAFILAGEANNPGSFSKRTINHIKLVSQNEANLFAKFCEFVVKTQDGKFMHILGKKTNQYLKENAGISVSKVTELEAAGFVLSTIRVKAKLYQDDLIYFRDRPYKIRLGNVKPIDKKERIIEEIDDLYESKEKKNIIVEFIGLSSTGGEIYPYACSKIDEGYFNLIEKELSDRGCKLEPVE